MTGTSGGVEQIERRSGVSLWRQIADEVRRIASLAEPGSTTRIPSEADLARRFGVNRHTVRSALAHLVKEGILRAEQGRGTFVEPVRRLTYPIATRTRFAEGFTGQATALASRLLAHAREPAPDWIAAALDLAPGSATIRLELLGEADGRAVSRATSWFPAGRLAGIAGHVRRTGSVTRALAALGVADYVRRSTTVSARQAVADELADLGLAPGAVVLVAKAVNADLDGRPIQVSRTSFAADRVELRLETEA